MRPTLYQLSQPSMTWQNHINDRLTVQLQRALRPISSNLASVAEWLRRQTQVLVLVEGGSSNLPGCMYLFCLE
jgi:hypothetical protein